MQRNQGKGVKNRPEQTKICITATVKTDDLFVARYDCDVPP